MLCISWLVPKLLIISWVKYAQNLSNLTVVFVEVVVSRESVCSIFVRDGRNNFEVPLSFVSNFLNICIGVKQSWLLDWLLRINHLSKPHKCEVPPWYAL